MGDVAEQAYNLMDLAELTGRIGARAINRRIYPYIEACSSIYVFPILKPKPFFAGSNAASEKCWEDALALVKQLGDMARCKQCLDQLCICAVSNEDWPNVSELANQLREVRVGFRV